MEVASVERPRAFDKVGWICLPLVVAVASRIFSALLLLTFANQATGLPLLTPYLSPFVAYDGQWYLHIAATGYHATALQAAALAGGHHDFAFYPGWPLLIRIVSLNALLPIDLTAVMLANFLFVLAAIAVYRLFADRFGDRAALWGILLLCFNPTAYVFSMAYTEGLFILIAALYFLSRYGRTSPVLAAVSVLTRVSGLAIAASAAVMFVVGRAPRVRLALICVAVAGAFAAWWIYIWQLTGNFMGWLDGSASWSKYTSITAIARDLVLDTPAEVARLAFIVLMILGCLLLLRRHLDLAIYGLVAIAMTLIGAPAGSMPRHAMVAFPAFGAIAYRLGPRLSAALLVCFVVAEVFFIMFAFGPGRQPP